MLEPNLLQPRSFDTEGTALRRGGAQNAQPEALPDLLLIERTRAADERAVEALVRRYARRLFRVARSVLPDVERAEGAVIAAYRAAFADLSRYEPTGRFAAWITRLAFDQAHVLRAARARAAGQPAEAPAAPQPAASAEEPAPELRELERAVEALPERFRTVFVLRVIEGISGVETAASLGLHETTVRTRLYRAHRRLAPETVRRVQPAGTLFEPSPACLERIVAAVLAAAPYGSMARISASPP
jgi:RNA polymerase sigma-70 factor, ECF subfamily